ncbi:uncharacterized protein LOC116307568 [Actinia tenebrosa]|uniref:Uncharacterized protein LOC116307568 n=1 Tax=Actinia tenebrosa TaxID=6105 RepID=A0A6P8J1D0_ACTTE|nr:uncharacterized protein LOC116307568 [Actinia tenebrosa]
MGAEESHMSLQPVSHDFGYLAVVFKIPDQIRVIHGSEAEYSIIGHAISDTWKEGIQSTKRKCAGSVLCFKLKGLPFETGCLSMNIREVACRILRCLNNIGCQYIASTNLTQGREWFTFIFVRTNTHQRKIGELAYVAMSSTDKLHFWNLQPNTRDEISQALHSEYHPGFYHKEITDGGKSYEAMLKGSPWGSTTSCHGQARGFLIKIIFIMMKRYSFLCAMNLKRTEDTFVFFPKSIISNTVSAEIFIISLRKTSKLQVFQAPECLIPIIHKVLVDSFGTRSHNIEKKIDHRFGKVEFKYKSHAAKDQLSQCTMTKFIVCKLLEVLKSHGWSIVTGFDMSRGLANKSELLFQKSNPHPDCKVFCLTPVCHSKLWAINAPPRIIEACRKVISRHLSLITETQYEYPATCVGFELGDQPWSDSGDSAHFTHSMICHLLDKFSHKGFKIKLTADVIPECIEYDEGSSTPHDPNAWWFMHEPQMGMPGVSEWKSEEVPLSQSSFEKPSEPLTPTAPAQSYEAPPPSYETVLRENEQKPY